MRSHLPLVTVTILKKNKHDLETDGPVLSQTDLYLLNTELEINPILEGKGPNQLQFHLVTGVHCLVKKNNDAHDVIIIF